MFDINSILLTSLVPTVLIIIVVVGVTAFVLRRVMAQASPNRDLLASGETAQATIVNLWQTGTSVNDQPLIGMLLQVQPASGQPYQVQTTQLISMLQIPQFQPGRKLLVKVDPKNPQRVAIAGAVA